MLGAERSFLMMEFALLWMNIATFSKYNRGTPKYTVPPDWLNLSNLRLQEIYVLAEDIS